MNPTPPGFVSEVSGPPEVVVRVELVPEQLAITAAVIVVSVIVLLMRRRRRRLS